MKLSVVIVSYNVKYYLAQCLRSVEKASMFSRMLSVLCVLILMPVLWV